ncbi:permease [Halococcus morrhuae DSM 1307]|uniref:Permease n=1 Tax=Halococcus morrhuae DSM 1307 TaxID=931277 RepID=M0MIX7_HALMO|nr:permease [Halococcus morrhuae]EMA45652.1 permease [Halococcus morrhuae DSM 1307]
MLPAGLESGLVDSWNYFIHLVVLLVPLFIGASFLVGLAQEYLPPERVERALRGHDEGSGNVAAAGVGAVTPFCSCSTVPVLAGLLQAGAPLGLAFSFLLASPLVNEIAVLLLVGLFGIEVTVYYVVITLVAAVIGGLVIGRLGLTEQIKTVRITDDPDQAIATDGGTADCCAGGTTRTERTHRQHVESAARDAWSFFVDTLPYLILGIVIGALIHGVVPVDVLRTVLGPENPLAVPLAALAGAPVYVSLSGMLPIAASLSGQGIAIGTVLAFVVGGAGVSIPNLILLNKLFKRRLLLVYAGTVVTIGTIVGATFNLLLV